MMSDRLCRLQYYLAALLLIILAGFLLFWQALNGKLADTTVANQAAGQLDSSESLTSLRTGSVTADDIADNTIKIENLNPDLVDWIHSEASKPPVLNVSFSLPNGPAVSLQQLLGLLNMPKTDTATVLKGALALASLSPSTLGQLQSLNGLPSSVLTIIPGSIEGLDIADGAIGSTQLADQAVRTVNIANGAVTGDLIAPAAIDTLNIASGAITNGLLAPGSVTTGDIASGAITNGLLATGSITNSDITNGAISTSDIASGAITNALLASSSVGSANIIDSSILASDIANGAIGSTQLANGSVLTTKLSTAANTHVVVVQVGNIAASLLSTMEWPIFVAPTNGTITKVTFTSGSNVGTGSTEGSLSLVDKASSTTVATTSLVSTPLTAFVAQAPSLAGGTSFSSGDVYSFKYAPGLLGVNLTGFLVTIDYTASE